jgi:RNA polymerase sigma factor (sigma-70 family)
MAIDDLQFRPVHTTGAIRILTHRTSDEQSAGELVRAAAEGDPQAWDVIVERFAPLVGAITRAHRLGADDRADVAQVTWLRLLEHLHRIGDPDRVAAWIATTARRECLRVLRGGRHVELCDELPEPGGSGDRPVDEAVLEAERDTLLWAAFARLPERDQALLRFLYGEDAPSYEEISEALGMPVGSIGPTRGRCLSRLRREVEALGVIGVG